MEVEGKQKLTNAYVYARIRISYTVNCDAGQLHVLYTFTLQKLQDFRQSKKATFSFLQYFAKLHMLNMNNFLNTRFQQ